MLEMSFLFSKADWMMKTMVLVIDDILYSFERKIQVIDYWMLRKKNNFNNLNSVDVGKIIFKEEKEYLDFICEQVAPFFQKYI